MSNDAPLLDLSRYAGHTPGPWNWLIHDMSMASLGVMPDPGLDGPLVMTSSPCRSCVKHAQEVGDNGWKWGRCHTPDEPDARLIADAPKLLAEIVRLRKERESLIAQERERIAALCAFMGDMTGTEIAAAIRGPERAG